MSPADLIRLMTLDGQVVGAGMLVALVWVVVTVRNLDKKVTGLDSKVSGLDSKVVGLATDVAFLRGRQAEQDRLLDKTRLVDVLEQQLAAVGRRGPAGAGRS